jgi:hypothetical protein
MQASGANNCIGREPSARRKETKAGSIKDEKLLKIDKK